MKTFVFGGSGSVHNHSWLEFRVPGVDWLPMNLGSITMGRQLITAKNCVEPELRQSIENELRFLRRFYFGSNDCLNMTVSSEAARVPCFLYRPHRGAAWKPVERQAILSRFTVQRLGRVA